MKPKKTWVVVANGDMARLFDLPARNTPLVPLDNHVWIAPENNEYADTQGMSHSSVGSSQRRMAPRTEPEDQALDAFARVISENLSAACKREEFERLALAAAPRLMGYLREHLDTDVRAKIWMEIDRDFTHLPLDKLRKVLEPYINL
jgi:protein required for attachment to host cells